MANRVQPDRVEPKCSRKANESYRQKRNASKVCYDCKKDGSAAFTVTNQTTFAKSSSLNGPNQWADGGVSCVQIFRSSGLRSGWDIPEASSSSEALVDVGCCPAERWISSSSLWWMSRVCIKLLEAQSWVHQTRELFPPCCWQTGSGGVFLLRCCRPNSQYFLQLLRCCRSLLEVSLTSFSWSLHQSRSLLSHTLSSSHVLLFIMTVFGCSIVSLMPRRSFCTLLLIPLVIWGGLIGPSRIRTRWPGCVAAVLLSSDQC